MNAKEKPARLSRRDFLKLGAGASVGLLLSSCTPQSPPAVVSKPSETLEKELNVLNWGAYVDFAIKPFEDKYKCKVNIEYYTDDDQAVTKVKAAPGKYDTFNIGIGRLDVVARQGLIQPLDVSGISTYQEMFDTFKPGPFAVDGKIYGICYAFGTNALMYNHDLIPEGVDSWEVFWDPKYKGKTSLVDKARDEWLATMLRLGLDFNNPKEEDWEKVKQSMKDRVANMRTLWTSEDEIKRLTIGKEIVVADSYDGLTAQISGEYPAIQYVIPKEGTYGWYDGPTLLTGAPHPNLAYKWIEFITSAEIGKMVAENVFYAPGNSKVPEMLAADIRKKVNLEDPQKILKSLKFYNTLGPDLDRRVTDAWTEAKASVG